jgi:hypothetical protein
MALELLWDRGLDDFRQELRVLSWVELDDGRADLLDGVVALVGDAVHAHGAPVAVAAGDCPVHTASSARFGRAAPAPVAGPADPHLAVELGQRLGPLAVTAPG